MVLEEFDCCSLVYRFVPSVTIIRSKAFTAASVLTAAGVAAGYCSCSSCFAAGFAVMGPDSFAG